MNLDEITDKDKLQSLAYEQMKQIELYQQNLRNVETRIQQVLQLPKPKVPVLKDKD